MVRLIVACLIVTLCLLTASQVALAGNEVRNINVQKCKVLQPRYAEGQPPPLFKGYTNQYFTVEDKGEAEITVEARTDQSNQYFYLQAYMFRPYAGTPLVGFDDFEREQTYPEPMPTDYTWRTYHKEWTHGELYHYWSGKYQGCTGHYVTSVKVGFMWGSSFSSCKQDDSGWDVEEVPE